MVRHDETAKLVADFGERIEKMRREGVPSYPPLGGRTPWAEASETRKLEEIVEHSTHVRLGAGSSDPGSAGPEVIAVPGTAALEMIERHVDYAGLSAVQRDMLLDLRAKLDAGQLGKPDPHGKDLVGMHLARIVGVGDLDRRLESLKQDADRPWDERPEAEKVKAIVDMAQEAGTPGAYTLEAIAREVDPARLPEWRRVPLRELMYRRDRGELAGENPNPLYQGDRADLALRLAELEARIEDYKQLGAPDAEGTLRPWRDLSEEQKLYEITLEIGELHLKSEAAAYHVMDREVDLTRVPEGWRQAVDRDREEAWPRPEREMDAFGRVVADLPRRWREDGYGGGVETWDEQSDIEKIGFLAQCAAEHHAPFWRFVEAAGRTLGLETGQEFAPEELLHLRRQFRWAHGDYVEAADGKPPLPGPPDRDEAIRADLAPRLAEFESRIADFQHLGVPDADGTRRPWAGLREDQKVAEIAFEMDELGLGSEPAAYAILGRAVDWARLPEELRREVEAAADLREQRYSVAHRDGTVTEEVRSPSRVIEHLGRQAGRATSPPALGAEEGRGDYQVWHVADYRQALVNRFRGTADPAFPEAYSRVATVQADSLDEVFSLTNHGENLWQENPGVVGTEARSTSVGDVIVDPRGRPYRVEDTGFKELPALHESPLNRVERELRGLKQEPEIYLESTRHYVQPDPESVEGIYDTCDALGPWHTLDDADKLRVLVAEFDWSGVSPEDRHRLLAREVDFTRVTPAEQHAHLGYLFEDLSKADDPAHKEKGTYQVWHDRGWPQGRLDQMLGGAPPSRFPQDYFHAADVQAGSLNEAVRLTTSTGRALHGDHQPWDDNHGVRSYTPKPFVPRDTDAGDVIVDPQGNAHRYDGHGFSEMKALSKPRLPSPGDIADRKDAPEPPGHGPEQERER